MLQGEYFQNPGGAAGFYDYDIPFSARFDRDDQSYLTQDFGSISGQKWTISVWVKRSTHSYDYSAIVGRTGGGAQLYFNTDNHLYHATHKAMETSEEYRDTGSWYHVVWNQATSTQAYCWVNGVAQTINVSGSVSTWYTPWDTDSTVGNVNGTSNVRFFDGYMAEMYGILGQDLDQNDFGNFKRGVWLPKSPSITFGSSDYYLKFADSSNLGLDSSGQSNNWTVNNMNADHQSTDTPTTGDG